MALNNNHTLTRTQAAPPNPLYFSTPAPLWVDTRWLSGISSTIFDLFLQNGQVVVALCRLIGIEQILMHLSFHHATSIIITSLDIYGSFCWCEMKNKNKINVRENRKGNQEWTIQTLEHTRHTVRTKTNKTKITTQK